MKCKGELNDQIPETLSRFRKKNMKKSKVLPGPLRNQVKNYDISTTVRILIEKGGL